MTMILIETTIINLQETLYIHLCIYFPPTLELRLQSSKQSESALQPSVQVFFESDLESQF